MTEETKQTISPDAEGYIYTPYLEAGSYYLKEVATTPGYKLDETPIVFTITDGAIQSIKPNSMTNNALKQTVTNVVGDPDTSEIETSTKIKDSTFKVYQANSCPTEGSTIDPANYK